MKLTDAGIFQCYAYNDVGEDFLNIWLKVTCKLPFFLILLTVQESFYLCLQFCMHYVCFVTEIGLITSHKPELVDWKFLYVSLIHKESISVYLTYIVLIMSLSHFTFLLKYQNYNEFSVLIYVYYFFKKYWD